MENGHLSKQIQQVPFKKGQHVPFKTGTIGRFQNRPFKIDFSKQKQQAPFKTDTPGNYLKKDNMYVLKTGTIRTFPKSHQGMS